MIQILADAEMEKQLVEAQGPVQMVNDKGTVIVVCTPINFLHSPYSREEVETIRNKYRQTGEGKSLAQILMRRSIQAFSEVSRGQRGGNRPNMKISSHVYGVCSSIAMIDVLKREMLQ